MEEILNGLYVSWPVVAMLAYLGFQMHKYISANETRLALIEEKMESHTHTHRREGDQDISLHRREYDGGI